MNRPSYVRCIKIPEARATVSWCGETHTDEWMFDGLDHAARNRQLGGRLLNCPECVSKAMEALNS